MKVDHVAITIGKKPFGRYKVISETAYSKDLVTQVTFSNQKFIWIPTWKEAGAIVEALYFAENLNRVNRGKEPLTFLQHLKKMKMKDLE